jgi:hypothetical protein
MRRPSRGLCWSVPISADSACNIGRPKHPTPSWGGRCSNPGENSGPGSISLGAPGELAQPPAIRERSQLKRLIWPTLGFQSMKTAYATIKGFEVMRMIRKRQCILLEPGVTGEVRFVNKLFDLAA